MAVFFSMRAPTLLSILARDFNTTSSTDTPLPVPDDSTVIWQAALWPLIALALNAMLQRSASAPFPAHTPFSPTRSSPVICLADVLVFLLWLICGLRVGAGIRASIWMYRKEIDIYDVDDNVLLRGTPAAGLILFVLVPLPQVLKVFGMQGVPVTQFLATMFLLAYVVGVVACTLGVPREGDGVMTIKLDKDARHTLVLTSRWTYYAAFLVQVVLWLVIAVVVFTPSLLTKVTAEASSQVHTVSQILYVGLITAFFGGGFFLLQYKGVGILFVIGGVIFTARVSQSGFQAWYTDQATSWVTTITIVVCLLVGVAISFAGVTVMTGINLVFSWMGDLISAPIPQPKKTESKKSSGESTPAAGHTIQSHKRAQSGDGEHNHYDLDSAVVVNGEQNGGRDASERFIELSDLMHPMPKETQGSSATATQVSDPPESVVTKSEKTESGNRDESRSTSTELWDLASPAPVFLPLRRAISLHFPTSYADHARMQKRPSVMLETGLLANVSAPPATKSESHKARSKPVAAGKASHTKTVSVKAKDYFWERGLAVGFAITNLIFGILYYRFLYSNEGTQKAPYAEVIG
ncbi:hypothetical protein MMC27_004099 [Xylographa pallens]|nr:hypothetical protein [Xylographa pallens]